MAEWAIDLLLMRPSDAIKELESRGEPGYAKEDLLPLLKRAIAN